MSKATNQKAIWTAEHRAQLVEVTLQACKLAGPGALMDVMMASVNGTDSEFYAAVKAAEALARDKQAEIDAAIERRNSKR